MKRSHIWIGVLLCVMFGAAVAALFLLEPPPGARDALLVLIGHLGGCFTQMVAYFYGSSSGSAQKSELMARMQPPEPPKG